MNGVRITVPAELFRENKVSLGRVPDWPVPIEMRLYLVSPIAVRFTNPPDRVVKPQRNKRPNTVPGDRYR
jgi:hypothetical protein